ncbi:MAG: glycosyltransferase family 4 protein [Candidatus Bathyarchaeota archaeon]
MKVGVISPALRKRGGIERVPVMQAKLLSESGYDVCIITSVYEKSCYPELLSDSKIEIRTPKIRLPLLEVTVNTIFSAFRSYRMAADCDLIIAHMLTDAYNAIHRLKVPCILYLHTLPRHPKRSVAERVDRKFRSGIMIPPHLLFKVFSPVTSRWSDLALEESDIVLVNSKNTGGQLEEYCGKRDYTVCYPAIDMERLDNRNRRVEDEVLSRFSLGKNLILAVSRHQPKKCLHWLPEIIHYVLEKVPDAQIAITGGETPHTELIRKNASRWNVKDRVILTGEVNEEELTALYHLAKALCFPSVREDFGLPIVEAMYCGCPPVAWDDDSGPSETIEDGLNGILVKPYDLMGMARGLTYLLKDEEVRVELSKNSSEKARMFNWKNHMDILELSIRRAMKKSGRGR